jgi:3-oxoacyl-[acyl-carrier protein] reductase
MRAHVLDQFDRIDVLVNNVGGFPTAPAPLIELTDADWHLSIDLNLTSAFLCCRAMIPSMIARKYGRVVNIAASLSAFSGVANSAHYCAAKAGLVAMTKALAREVAHHGITANIIAPGHIDTPLTRAGAALGWWDDEEELRGISSGRAGSATDVAAALMLFASQEAGWITGQTLHVNGGSLMW